MLLANLGVMVGVYIGAEVFKYLRDKKLLVLQPTEKIQYSSQPEEIVEENTLNIQQDKLNVIESTESKNIETKSDPHLKISVVALGLSAVNVVYPPLSLLTVGVITYATIPMFKDAEKSLLKERRIKNDLLTSIVSVMCIAMGKYVAGALGIVVYHWGSQMLIKSKDMSTQMITNVFEQQPSKVWILKELVEIEIPLEALQVDDIVIVKAGEVVPIDGIITHGMAMIDQHALTGEAVPAEKGIGDQVFAATIMVSGRIQVRVEKTGIETTVSKLGDILNHTAEFKTTLQMQGEKWADRVSAPLLGVAALSSPIIGTSSATAILYGAPTNTIRVLTSLQTLNHLTLISSKGILVKDGRVFEELNNIDTLFFDKTGTLTEEQLKAGQIILCGELGEEEILRYAASAEDRFSHPIARAIIEKAKEQSLNLFDIEETNYTIGYGITVNFKNQVIKVGSARFMTSEGITLPPIIEAAIERSQENGYSLVMVAINHELKGAIEIQPQIRPEVKKIIKGLRQRGIQQMFIVSGDHKQPTQKLAKELGMDNYFYEMLPQDKASLVEQFQKKGHRVCFVGDGINDTIAMKKANVSISLRGASSIATDTAQVVLMDGSLSRLCDVFDLSKKLNTNLKYSLLFWAGYGITNVTSTVFLHFGVTKLMSIYAVVFGLGVGHAMLPLKQLEHNKE
ncbi:heavy metal translocating P-type ATPase [Candidatus Parabeggiatoa sp. HSG14]|uniref:heavy metal translocating P-type ATPase n=1 Tax=Candidatus Parabeggiatoa sp. HSG14 TaxID=3055593 RepID=UPI0032E5099A